MYDALQELFHSEYILLAEYIECALCTVPCGNLSPASCGLLPKHSINDRAEIERDRDQHPNLRNLAAFVALLVILRWKFGFSSLYQLAFVLETQAPALQGHLFVWTITILHLTLAHYGTKNERTVFVIMFEEKSRAKCFVVVVQALISIFNLPDVEHVEL